jgi:alkylated DNA repair dioxygenase AlkB
MKPLYFPFIFHRHGISRPIDMLTPDKLFNHLMELDWLEATETRKEYFMSDQKRSYVYGKGKGERLYISESYSFPVLAVQYAVDEICNTEFNLCFLNRYDDQRQHLGWHADDTTVQDDSVPIAVVSLGAEREIWWKKQGDKGPIPPEQRQLLAHGSLFIMPPYFQNKFYHKIPKSDKPCGTRISLTFRKTSN